ncbi:MAG: hypothetical protein N2254_02875 [bacterium]|nr:hypothetical protein [bacterium]
MIKFFFSIIILSLAVLILSRVINVKYSDGGICLSLKDSIKESFSVENKNEDYKRKPRAIKDELDQHKGNKFNREIIQGDSEAEKTKQRPESKIDLEPKKSESSENEPKKPEKENSSKAGKSEKINKQNSEDPIEEIIKKNF